MSIMRSISCSGAARRIVAGIAGGLVLLLGTSGVAVAGDHYRYDRGWHGDRYRGYEVRRDVADRRWRRARRIDVYYDYEEEPPVVVVHRVYPVPPPVVRERVIVREVYREVPPPRPVYRAAAVPGAGPNAGGLIGAALGGFLGSQMGGGDGKLAATAAGTIGGFLLGSRVFGGAYAR